MRDTRPLTTQSVVRLTVMALVFAVAACDGAPGDAGDPSIQQLPVDSIVLAPGQDVRVQLLRLSFLDVTGDSRCPIDVVCIWQGNAAVEIALGLGMGASHPVVLNTAEGTPSVELWGYRVTLLALLPAPRSGIRIPPEAYRAIFRVDAVTRLSRLP
jgi:hypothetical protein